MRNYAMVQSLLERDLESYHRSPEPFENFGSQEVAAALLRRELFKKLAPSGQSKAAVAATIKKFVGINNSVSFVPPNDGDDESTAYMLSLARDEVRKLLDADSNGVGCDFGFIRDHLATGPGASRKADSTTWYSKLWESNHSYTEPYVLALFRAALVESDTWSDAYMHWSRRFKPQLVPGNSLFTVPKNSEVSRTCCTEPLLNMMFQKAIGSFMEERLNRWGINLSKQPDLNRRLCRIGSVDGSFGTIDLSSASDSIALTLCEWIIPPQVFKWLRLFRSPTTRLPDGSEAKLNMVSTMGNGFTFPLETIIFASVVRAVYLAKGISPRLGTDSDNYAVFGDDLVVRKDCFHTVERMLKRFGFSVNEGKSFNFGSFRESCGFDYFDGINIRPVYIETLETPQDVYSAFNRLSRWQAEHRIPLVRTLKLLLKWARFRPIPFSEADDSGFKVPVQFSPFKFSEDGWFKYSCLEPVSTALAVPRDRPTALKAGYTDFNPFGWELAFLGSYAQNPSLPLLNPLLKSDKLKFEKPNVIHRRPFQGEVLRRRVEPSLFPFGIGSAPQTRGASRAPRLAPGKGPWWKFSLLREIL